MRDKRTPKDACGEASFALNQKKSVGVIFIDFQKAFDCVSHQLFPLKLQVSGFCNVLFHSTSTKIFSGIP